MIGMPSALMLAPMPHESVLIVAAIDGTERERVGSDGLMFILAPLLSVTVILGLTVGRPRTVFVVEV
jgi:hypothetical protein